MRLSSAAFNSFHGVSMALVNNYRNELIKWPPGQTTKKSEDMKGFLGVVKSVGHKKRLLGIETTISIKSLPLCSV